MGLTGALARSAAQHAHALVVEVPGWDGLRMAAERAVLDRGWRLAWSPADADVLVVCGLPGRRLAEAVDLVWEQLPGPRVRVEVLHRGELADALAGAHAGLLDDDHHRRDARARPGARDLLHAGAAADEHGETEEHEDGGGHDDMEMSPGGIPLAEGGEDRDGLEMDVLEMRLGPVLPHWPAGLLLHCSLQGDVLTDARAEVLGAAPDAGHPDGAAPRARELDRVVSVLALAGWDDAADRARRLRDGPAAAAGQAGSADLARLRHRVRRSRLLRRSLRGLGNLTEDDVRRLDLPAEAVGDAHDRLLGLLERLVAAAPPESLPAVPVDDLAALVVGLDLGAARLVTAGLELGRVPTASSPRREATHG